MAITDLSPTEQRLASRKGGLTTWTRDPEGARRRLAAAKRKQEAGWTEAERKLHYTNMALKSLQVRRAKKAAAE